MAFLLLPTLRLFFLNCDHNYMKYLTSVALLLCVCVFVFLQVVVLLVNHKCLALEADRV